MARGRGTVGRNLGPTRYVGSVQNNGLVTHLPLTDFQHPTRTDGSNSRYPTYKDTVGDFRAFIQDPNSIGLIARHPTRGIYMPKFSQQYGGSNAVIMAATSSRQIANYGFGGNTKDWRTPKRFTVSIWFRQISFGNQYVLVCGDVAPQYDSGSYPWMANWMIRLESNVKARFYICDGSNTNKLEIHAPLNSYTVGKDTHVAMTFDGRTLKGYTNGVLSNSGTFAFDVGQAVGNLELCSCRQSLFNVMSLSGWFWDFRMYARALSQAEIKHLYYYTDDLYRQEQRWKVSSPGVVYTKTVVSDMTTSDAIALHFGRRQSVVHTASVEQIAGFNLGLSLTVSQSVTTSQSLNRVYLQSVTQNVTASQSSTDVKGKYYTKSVFQSFAAYQDIGKKLAIHVTLVQGFNASDLPQSDLTNIRQSISVTQVVAFNRALNQRVAQAVFATQDPFVNSPRILSVSHAFTSSDTSLGRNSTTRQIVSQSLTASQTVVGRNSTFKFTVSQSFGTSYTLYRRDAIIRMSLTNSMVMAQRVNTYWYKRVEQDINAVDIAIGHRHVYRTFHTDTTVAHDFSKQRIIPRTVGTVVDETSTLERRMIYTREQSTAAETSQEIFVSMQASTPKLYLPAISSGPPAFGVPNVPRPGISGVTQIANLVKLTSGSSTILLPTPQLQNTIADVSEIKIIRTISGRAISHKKTTGKDRFSYTFWLDLVKSLELRDWLRENMYKTITITNWRGESWSGNVTTDLPQFTSETVRQGDALEKVVVTLEFQGVKIHG